MVRVAVALSVSVAVLAACSHGSRPSPKAAEPPPEAPSPCTTAVATGDYLGGGFSWWEQPGIAPRRIAGVVTYEGKPVAGARVRLSTEKGEELTTGEDGRFDFGERAATVHGVTAEVEGLAGAWRSVDLRNPTPYLIPDQLELELHACNGVITGLVTDDHGTPVAGARVGYGRSGPGALTDAAGRYRLCESHEVHWLTVSAKGHPAIKQFVSEVGAGAAERHFVLPSAGTVSGRTLAADGKPIAGVTVAFDPASSAETLSRTVESDADGRFTQPELADGAYRVTARGDDVVLAEPRWILVAAGRAEELTLTLEPAATVRGHVRDEGKPVAGAVVRVATERGVVVHAISQLDGSFVATGVPRASVVVSVEPFGLAEPVTLEVGAAAAPSLDLSVKPSARVCGVVVRGGTAAAGELVMASGPDFAIYTTDRDGRFALVGLGAGLYEIEVSSSHDSKHRVQLKEGEVFADLAVVLPPSIGAHSLGGVVVDQAGAPVAGATVSARSKHARGHAATAADGSFQITGLPAGDYALTVSIGGVRGGRLTENSRFPKAMLIDGAPPLPTASLQVRYERRTIEGRVVDAAGAPRGGALVLAARHNPNGEPFFDTMFGMPPMAVSDPAGRFELPNLPAGDYDLRAITTDGEEIIVSGVQAGGPPLSLRLQATGAIDVRVVGFSEPADIRVWREHPRATAQASAGGVISSFGFGRLPPGRYLVTAETRAETAFAYVDVVGGQTAKVELASPGIASVEAQVVDFMTGKGVPGMNCNVGVRAPTRGGSLSRFEHRATSGEAGKLTMEKVPAGELLVACYSPVEGSWARAGVTLTVKPGERAVVRMKTVRSVEMGAGSMAGIAFEFMQEPGARVERVWQGSPAAAAGLQPGDVIEMVDGKSVDGLTGDGVDSLIRSYKPMTELELGVVRGGKGFKVKVKLVADQRKPR